MNVIKGNKKCFLTKKASQNEASFFTAKSFLFSRYTRHKILAVHAGNVF